MKTGNVLTIFERENETSWNLIISLASISSEFYGSPRMAFFKVKKWKNMDESALKTIRSIFSTSKSSAIHHGWI